jgi:hypothetical protein
VPIAIVSHSMEMPVLRSISQRLSYANVMATAALFVALGGASYAATQLPANSVGSKQLKSKAVTKAKIDPAVLKALAGKIGLTGPQGAVGANGANGTNGVNGTNLTTQTPLASGQTEVGSFGAGSYEPSSDDLVVAISFAQPLAAPLDGAHVIDTVATPAHCPGAGRADPGFLCVYRPGSSNVTLDPASPFDPVALSLTGGGATGAGTHGAVVLYKATSAGYASAYGSWAVTAP